MEGLTPHETRLAADSGRHAAAAQAFIRLGLILETDETSPVPTLMTCASENGTVTDTLWGFAALPSAGDDAGTAAVDKWAARHHVTASWADGRYKAVMHLGGRLRYGVLYTPERTLYPDPAQARPELTGAAA
jgi:hypothetical protein